MQMLFLPYIFFKSIREGNLYFGPLRVRDTQADATSVRLLNRLCIYSENLDIEMTTLEI